ncbi:DUF3592 domain-containing protein [Streptomyces carminius]|uniref:DUF3592 domain-containing protein n=1 Tax=Streptomyces carminius TaxID=2665496 RepID=UPI0013047C2C|nr:DUF3592 domain-containing protein [Streptomyces carminius]
MLISALSRPAAVVLGLLCLFSGGVLALVTAVTAADVGKEQRVDFDRRTDAVVSERRTQHGGGPNGPVTVVLVEYTAGGKPHTARLSGGAERTGLRAGDVVEVVYRADRPDRPYTREYAESEPPGVVGQIVGVGIVALACVLFLGLSIPLLLSARR